MERDYVRRFSAVEVPDAKTISDAFKRVGPTVRIGGREELELICNPDLTDALSPALRTTQGDVFVAHTIGGMVQCARFFEGCFRPLEDAEDNAWRIDDRILVVDPVAPSVKK